MWRRCGCGRRRRGALLGFSLSEAAERFVDLDQLFPSAAQVRERLAEATVTPAGSRCSETWLTRHVRGAPDGRVGAAVRAIAASGGRASIDALARMTGPARAPARTAVPAGGGPDTEDVRAHQPSAARLRCIRDGAALSAAAVTCGFYDQAHMALDFRQLAAMSPRAWRNMPANSRRSSSRVSASLPRPLQRPHAAAR